MFQSRRLNRDIVWNVGSVFVLGVCGLALNFIIGRFYGAEAYGTFAQVLAIYVVLSQLAAAGFNFSVMSYAGEYADDPLGVKRVVSAALLLVVGSAAVVTVGTVFLSHTVGSFLESADVGEGLLWVAPGLLLFPLNKVLINALNGLRHMRMYATAQALRYVFIILALVTLVTLDAESVQLPVILSASECLLLILLLGYFLWIRALSVTALTREWVKKHISFAIRSLPSGLFLDLNTKVDILMLGYFANDGEVGVYAFAAMLSEGFGMLVHAVRANMTPILSRLKVESRESEAKNLVRRATVVLCPILLVCGAIGVLLYSAVIGSLTGSLELASGGIYFGVLMVGIALSAGYISVMFVLNQWGEPHWFSLYAGAVVATNAALNALLIPVAGALGAAIATAGSMLLSVVYLKFMTRRVTGIPI